MEVKPLLPSSNTFLPCRIYWRMKKKGDARVGGFKTHSPRRRARQRMLAALQCSPVDRPPVWLMRQAGRCLPEYRLLKEKYTFRELVQIPELAAEVTLQPVRRFHFDAAIIFSDILVIPEALGQGYSFREGGGVKMDYVLKDRNDLRRLNTRGVSERFNTWRKPSGWSKQI